MSDTYLVYVNIDNEDGMLFPTLSSAMKAAAGIYFDLNREHTWVHERNPLDMLMESYNAGLHGYEVGNGDIIYIKKIG
jgi:hypothetical protein